MVPQIGHLFFKQKKCSIMVRDIKGLFKDDLNREGGTTVFLEGM